jgi:hypothetical protein
MTRAAGLLAFLALRSGCAASGPTAPSAPDSPATTHEPDVAIASYLAPATSRDATEARLVATLAAHRIRWVSYGSLGYTLAVPGSQAAEARAWIRAEHLPNLTLLDDDGQPEPP